MNIISVLLDVARTTEDVKNIYIRKGDRILQLKELCKVDVVSQKESGTIRSRRQKRR